MTFKNTLIILAGIITFQVQAQIDEISFPIKHSAQLTKMIYSHDKHVVYTASEDKTIKLWDVNSKEPLRTFYGHNAQITVLCVNDENTQLFTGDKSGTVISWDTKTGKSNKTICLKEPVTSMLYLENKNMLLIGTQNNSLTFLNASTFDTLKTISTSPYYPTQMLISKDNETVIVGFSDTSSKIIHSNNGTIQMLDVSTYKLFPISTYTESLSNLAFSPDSEKIISSSSENDMIRVWDTEKWIEEISIKNPVKPSVVFMSENNRKIGVGSGENGQINIYRFTGELMLEFKINKGRIITGEFNDEHLQICNNLGMFREYDLNGNCTGTLADFVQSNETVTDGNYNVLNKALILGYANGKNKLFNLKNEQFICLQDSFKTAVCEISSSPNLPLTALFYLPDVHYNEINGTSMYNSKLVLTDTDGIKVDKIFSYNLKYVTSAYLSTDYLFTGFNDGTIEIYDVKNNKPVSTIKISPFDILGINYSEENSMLFLKTIDNKIQLFQFTPPNTFKFNQSVLISDNENMLDARTNRTNICILTNKRCLNATTSKKTYLSIYTGKFVSENKLLLIPATQDSLFLLDLQNNQILWKEKLSYPNPVSLFCDTAHHFAGIIYSLGTIQFFGLNNGNSLGTLFLNDNNAWLYMNSEYFDASETLLPHVHSINGFNIENNNTDILKKRKENLMQQELFGH